MSIVLREESDDVSDALLKDISPPPFLEEFTDPAGLVLIQSPTGFDSPPKYEHHEQFICSIDGMMLVKLVPHIFRQEVYAGGDRITKDPEDRDSEVGMNVEKCEPNESPANFFNLDYEQYPLLKEIDKVYLVILHEGHCMYVPAFYFH